MTFGEYLRLGTEQILLYGEGDPLVVAALDRMARSLASKDLGEADRKAVEFLRSRVAAISATGQPLTDLGM